MSHIGKKIIFFSPTIQIYKNKNFLIIGDNLSQTCNSQANFSKLQFNIPLEIKVLRSQSKDKNMVKSTEGVGSLSLILPQASNNRGTKSLWGTFRALLAQTLRGFYKKHTITLKFVGVGYKASLKKNVLILRLGFSHKLFCKMENNLTITKIKKRPIVFLLQSHFLDIVKTTAFRLRAFKKPEPYKGKGILLMNEFLKLKEGKKTSK